MVVGQMALYNHPCRMLCLQALLPHVDKVYLRQDVRAILPGMADLASVQKIIMFCKDKFGGLLISATPWDATGWREEMLRMLDTVKPTVVLCPDEDEMFTAEIDEDIAALSKLKRGQMAFGYKAPMPTRDGFDTGPKPYPSKPHVKAYRWQKHLTYLPYKRRARLANFDKHDMLKGHAQILHYSMYTQEMRDNHPTTAKGKIEANNA